MSTERRKPYPFDQLEPKWQARWEADQTFHAPNPGEPGFDPARPKYYVLDMFPYPSGAGLHVGHPEGYTATDILGRFKKMCGFNVLHPMGWDAFGLPAEQYAIKTGQHPAITTAANVAHFKGQLQRIGFGYDWQREVNTTDPGYFRWTQWIFLQLYHSYFDPELKKARPIALLDDALRTRPQRKAEWEENVYLLGTHDAYVGMDDEHRALIREELLTRSRLAYVSEAPVNWCPELGTVLANEEVVDGKSEVGGFPVVRRPMQQWMLRITAYAQRLIDELEGLDWPEGIKLLQKNWIGASEGARVNFGIDGSEEKITVFTTRPDTLYGATYMVLAPEHSLVDDIVTEEQAAAVEEYREKTARKSDLERTELAKEKSGVWTGAFAINPVNGKRIPIWIADYVLQGYGTGAIMAVPAHDERDWEFARQYALPIRAVVSATPTLGLGGGSSPCEAEPLEVFGGEGYAIHSGPLDGLPTAAAKAEITRLLTEQQLGFKTVNYKLRDWLFSRQRYWGEPFPIVWQDGAHRAISENELPLNPPELADFKPTGTGEPPLARATDWVQYRPVHHEAGEPAATAFPLPSLGLIEGAEAPEPAARRETNTMPQWAGSCWYYLRYCDARNADRFVGEGAEKYWMQSGQQPGGVDLYVGGTEHAVLHLLYARFWHKVLFDLGHVSTPEPFQRLVNQGLILGETEYTLFSKDLDDDFADEVPVSTNDLRDITEEVYAGQLRMVGYHKTTGEKCVGRAILHQSVEKVGDGFYLKEDRAIRLSTQAFKMSKSRGNVVNPDTVIAEYGADALRCYLMFMGPLEASKPWSMNGVEGVSRFLARVWRLVMEENQAGEWVLSPAVQDIAPDKAQMKMMHATIKKVGEDIEALSFNTAISQMMIFVNLLTGTSPRSQAAIRMLLQVLNPFAPHLTEELWERLAFDEGGTRPLPTEPWPGYDPALLIEDEIEMPIQVNGKVRDKIVVKKDATKDEIEAAARDSAKIAEWTAGKEIRKVVVVPGKLVNIVV